jgi:2'-5' RNA ligase
VPTQDNAPFLEGETGLDVTVPDAEPLVQRWRGQFDPSAAAGMPAHITVLYPFLHRRLIDAEVISELETIFGRHDAFDLLLVRCQRFPNVLYLQPEPDSPLRALTGAVAGRWPEAPPYGGRFADVLPHLTVAQGQEPAVLDSIEADLADRLPIATRVSAVRLHVCSGGLWREEHAFALGSASRAAR